jgi:nucleoid-associated protein YgaU
MDERLKFIARLLDGEKMAVLCRQFGISRKTGYKILTRYNEIRSGRAYRPLAPALPPREPAALPDRDADRALEAGQAELGGAEDQGKAGPALSQAPRSASTLSSS